MARPGVLLGVAGGALAVFTVLLVAVAVHRGPLPFDAAVRDWVAANATPEGRDLVLPLARMGAREALVPVLLAGGLALWWRRRAPGPLLLLVGSYLGMAMVVGPAKKLLHRPEPLDLPGEIGRSFPSGHGAQAVLVFGLLAALLAADPVGRRARPVLVAVPVVCSALVGIAMVYRNAHWLSDVVAGYAIGVVWTAGPLALAHLAAPGLFGFTPVAPTDRAPEAAARRR
ncbi:MAG TPA: phosphatase PAP2 family protein [Acidimicrobiales bacterium]|nr:phosphatase PAP2 family protein [Acidimicrobiales bacterium]